ncbi:P-loop containing nucleoside triphosphate hydrolase [Sesbania bispinosa]|nr:P-loop containing nucleoside triphosphate hydrolase [Sesbania bispinosa]
MTDPNPTVKSGRRRTIMPFTPLYLTFENITYSVDMPKAMKSQGLLQERLELLKGVSGAFRPGVLTALMGVSGAGKTTLFDVLAGRKNTGYIEGNINVSGYPKNQGTFARVSGYCEQNDIHSPLVTVHESLLYSAWLRLPAEVDPKTRELFVEEVMELVELTPLRDALVGFPNLNGLAIEQRKRLTIAVELVANPSIIFMDEPTSGLDARAAAIVMRTVRNTVDTGRTVVCTIHQPSIDIFESFDELFLLTRGGEEIYVGPIGPRSHYLIDYFEPVMFTERTVFYREKAAGMYSVLPYAIAQVAIQLPYTAVQVTIYGIITYAMMGFEWTAAKFFYYLFFLFITVIYFIYFGMMLIATSPNQAISSILDGLIYTVWTLFIGFLIPIERR